MTATDGSALKNIASFLQKNKGKRVFSEHEVKRVFKEHRDFLFLTGYL